MIVQLTWHGEPIGKLDVQFVWPPPLDCAALPLLSVSSGGAAISVLFQFSGALDALELDLARPIVLHGPLGGPTEVGPFQGQVDVRFDELAVHGFVAGPLGSRGGNGQRILLQREPGAAGFAVSGRALVGQLEIADHSGLLTFGAAVEGPSSQLRAYPEGGGVIEVYAAGVGALVASLNWRWPRSFDEESPWAVALQALLGFITEQASTTLRLGFELAPEEQRDSGILAAETRAPAVDAPLSERATDAAPAAPAPRSRVSSRAVLLGGVAVAVAAFIAAAVFWNPSGIRNSTVLLPAGTVSTGALQPARSGAAGDAGGKR